MKLNLNRCSLVLSGSWNQSIFTPERVHEKLLLEGKIPDLRLAFTSQGWTFQFVAETVIITVAPSSVQILAKSGTNASFEQRELIAERLLTWLPETPVNALGINYGLDITEQCPALESILSPCIAEIGALGPEGLFDSVSVKRAVRYDDHILNMNIVRSKAGPTLLDANHHFAVMNAREANTKLHGASIRVLTLTRRAAQLLYGLTTEESWTDIQHI